MVASNWGRLSNWFRRITVLGLALVGLAAANIAGCPRPEFFQMIEGVTADQIIAIHDDETLDQEGKRQALFDLGIDDPQLAQVLIDAATPVASN
jgi:hypothetical protein